MVPKILFGFNIGKRDRISPTGFNQRGISGSPFPLSMLSYHIRDLPFNIQGRCQTAYKGYKKVENGVTLKKNIIKVIIKNIRPFLNSLEGGNPGNGYHFQAFSWVPDAAAALSGMTKKSKSGVYVYQPTREILYARSLRPFF